MPMYRIGKTVVFLACLFFVFSAFAESASAQHRWRFPLSGNWFDPNAWDPAFVPNSNSDVLFKFNSSGYTVLLPAGQINSLTFRNSGSSHSTTFLGNGGSTLAVDGAIELWDSTGGQTNLTFQNQLATADRLNLVDNGGEGSNMSLLNSSLDLFNSARVGDDSVLTLDSGSILESLNFTQLGETAVDGNSTIDTRLFSLEGDMTVQGSSLLDVSGRFNQFAGSTLEVSDNSTFQAVGFGIDVDLNGTVRIDNSTFEVSGIGSNTTVNGSVDIKNNSSWNVDGIDFLGFDATVSVRDNSVWNSGPIGFMSLGANIFVDDSTWNSTGDILSSINSDGIDVVRSTWNHSGDVEISEIKILGGTGNFSTSNITVTNGEADFGKSNVNGIDVLNVSGAIRLDAVNTSLDANEIFAQSLFARTSSFSPDRDVRSVLQVVNGIFIDNVYVDASFVVRNSEIEPFQIDAGFIEQGDSATLSLLHSELTTANVTQGSNSSIDLLGVFEIGEIQQGNDSVFSIVDGSLVSDSISQGFNSSANLSGNISVGYVDQKAGSSLHFDSGILTMTDSQRAFYSIGAGEVFNSTRQLHNAGRTIVQQAASLELSEGGVFSAGRLTNLGSINVSTDYTFGDSTRFDGYQGGGQLTVDNATLTINDANVAELGRITSLRNDSTIVANNGVLLGNGFVLEGHGTVNGKVAAGTGSLILSSGGNLTLGNDSKFDGFASQGELRTGGNTVTLLDANQALLGSLTEVGGVGTMGQLVADNGLVINAGGNLIGYGQIDSINSIEAAIINDGFVSGNSESEHLTFTGYVKGVGTFENVTFDGTFNPGHSPAELHVGNLSFSENNLLIMELAGLQRGEEFDALVSDGLLSIDGELRIELIDGFDPVLGNSFDLLDWNSVSGEFDAVSLPTLNEGLAWDTSELYSTGVLSITAVPEPGVIPFAVFIGCCVWSRCRRNRR